MVIPSIWAKPAGCAPLGILRGGPVKAEKKSVNDRPYDYIVIGSGFGGSVAALRLTEKGYRVLVLEAGRRFRDQDFAKTSWDLRRFLYLPRLGLNGIMRLDFFKGLTVLSGAGVGGGSLVYANTLIEPEAKSFANGTWPSGSGVEDWQETLAPHYAEARRMLGVTEAPQGFAADELLQDTAKAMGYGESYHPVNVGVFLGQPGVEVQDPYFGGEGPARKGCMKCGGCMVGCRHNAKNTLVKNYLYFAEKRGAEVVAEAEATEVVPATGGGYLVTVKNPGLLPSRRRVYRGENVIFASGVLGTLKLLLKCRDEAKTLPNLSPALGTEVRTNSESIIGVRRLGLKRSFSDGVAIAAGVNPNEYTKIEAVRYSKGSDAMGLMSMPLAEGATYLARLWSLLKGIVTEPVNFVRYLWPKDFATETVILLVMQSLDSKMRLGWKRRLVNPFRRGLVADFGSAGRPPVHLKEGNEFAKKMADLCGGRAGGSVADVLGMSFTAHVLGGCPMSRDAATGVIDHAHQVHGYPGLYVVGGASVPANLGVNPSLTITAMAERAMALIPAKAQQDQTRRPAA